MSKYINLTVRGWIYNLCLKITWKTIPFRSSHRFTRLCWCCAVGVPCIHQVALQCAESTRFTRMVSQWPSLVVAILSLHLHGHDATCVRTFKFPKNEMFFSRSLVRIKYCGNTPWPRGRELCLRPPGLEFRILCPEGSVISPIPGDSPGPV